ncbi:hypothetical protein [Crocinitomix catalasitica]|uniref:hypothetical protein n=1 Tax=Crocinitomix catalasitica TaxID=184607 RepID=UPI0004825FE1|nr:hypothetical protein [Crocinitomix catalasitica]
MNLEEKIASLDASIRPAFEEDILQMQEDIYRYLAEIDGFDVRKVEPTVDPKCRLKAVCQTTISEPFFNIIVRTVWQTSLAFDEEWHRFTVTELGIEFEFLTWVDEYVSGKIWFEHVKKEIQP